MYKLTNVKIMNFEKPAIVILLFLAGICLYPIYLGLNIIATNGMSGAFTPLTERPALENHGKYDYQIQEQGDVTFHSLVRIDMKNTKRTGLDRRYDITYKASHPSYSDAKGKYTILFFGRSRPYGDSKRLNTYGLDVDYFHQLQEVIGEADVNVWFARLDYILPHDLDRELSDYGNHLLPGKYHDECFREEYISTSHVRDYKGRNCIDALLVNNGYILNDRDYKKTLKWLYSMLGLDEDEIKSAAFNKKIDFSILINPEGKIVHVKSPARVTGFADDLKHHIDSYNFDHLIEDPRNLEPDVSEWIIPGLFGSKTDYHVIVPDR